MSFASRHADLTEQLAIVAARRAQETKTMRAMAVAGLARDLVATASLGVASLNREAALMAEGLAPDTPWATDEPLPDLSYLWELPRLTQRPRWSYGRRYRAWIDLYPDASERAV